MTNEEAKQELINLCYDCNYSYGTECMGDVACLEAKRTAIKALEQEPCKDVISIPKDALKWRGKNMVAYNVEWLREYWQKEMDIVCGIKPCEDAISRQAVEEALYDYSRSCDVNYAQIMEYIDTLPTVTPKQRTGHWISHYDDEAKVGWYECSCCQSERAFNTSYCPDCGAKMVEPQESGGENAEI